MERQGAGQANSDQSDKGRPEGNTDARKPSFFRRMMRPVGWLVSGPADWFGRKSVDSGAHLIGNLWQGVRTGTKRDSRFKVDENGGFDLAATAFSYGLSVEALQLRMRQRQRTTSMTSYGALIIAVISVIVWIYSAVEQPYTFARLMMVWQFLPFIGLFLLLAFYNALLNFQIRLRRSASWREFMSTDEGFFPRW
jgi:hypothetical protein